MNSHPGQILNVLSDWLKARLDGASATWVQERQSLIRSNDKKAFLISFGITPRKVGKVDLALSNSELLTADSVRPGWNPRGWSVDQAVRTLFVLSLWDKDPSSFGSTLDQLFATGEVGELVALYQMLPLFPNPAAYVLRAAEGIRTNIKAVFCAVAHQNPFPAEQFSEDQWNQMVLKCQFIGVPMSPIAGLDRRANPRLASMVLDFVHERWAAHRVVPPDMWRCVGRFADQQGIDDLKNVLLTGASIDRQAAALALSESRHPDAANVLSMATDLKIQVQSGTITWASIDEATQTY